MRRRIDDGKPRCFRVNDLDSNLHLRLPSNYIVTTIYTLYNFLPLSLMNQFRRVSNMYFAAITASQFIPLIRVYDPWSGMLPLLFILGLSMFREMVEDLLRYQSDRKINSTPVNVVRNGREQSIRSDELCVGDLMYIKQDEVFAADLILLGSSLPEGHCYISTSSLDGEKNLKKKFTARGTSNFVSCG